MTVRINKPAINLREKLAELDKPSGIVGEQVLRSDTAEDAREALNLEEHLFESFESTGIQDNATSTQFTVSDTGVDVTGTVTADGLTVDGESDLNATVTIRHANPRIKFIENDSVNANTQFSNDAGNFAISTMSDAESTFTKRFNLNHATGDVSFFEDSGSTAKMVWDASAENLSIGNIEGLPNGSLSLKTTASGHAISLEENSGTERWQLGVNAAGDLEFVNSADSDASIVFDDSGNVGIGTASPDHTLRVNGDGRVGNLHIKTSEYTAGTGKAIWADTAGTGVLGLNSSTALQFNTNNTERARIDSLGNLLVGKTALDINVIGHQFLSDASGDYAAHTSQDTRALLLNRKVSDGEIVDFRKNGAAVGSIGVTGSTTSYNTSSDERLKENIQNTTHTVDINDIRVREFDWKAGGEHQRFGFIAQELETVYPEAVHSPEDPKEMKSVDYSKLVPLLVKEIQTLKARIEELEK